MAIELEPKGVAAVVLYPGAVSTEFSRTRPPCRRWMSTMQTPTFVGEAAARLITASDLQTRSGTIQWVEDLAEEFDLTEADDLTLRGRNMTPLTHIRAGWRWKRALLKPKTFCIDSCSPRCATTWSMRSKAIWSR